METKEVCHSPASPRISQMCQWILSFLYGTCTFHEFYKLCNCLFNPVCSVSGAPITARDWGSLVIELITKVSVFTLRYFLKTLITGIQCF